MSMVTVRDNVYSGVVMPYRLTRTTAGDLNANEIVLMIAKEENHMVDFKEEVAHAPVGPAQE